MNSIEDFKKNPFVNRSTGFEVFLEIQNRIIQQIPTSMIRLGDGEGIVMGYPEISSRADVDRKWKVWLGDSNITDDDVIDLSQSVRVAISEADIVGIARKKQCDSSYLWKNIVTEVVNFDLLNESQIITDTAIHRYLQFSLLYRSLLSEIDFLGIISSRDIGAKLKSTFGCNPPEN